MSRWEVKDNTRLTAVEKPEREARAYLQQWSCSLHLGPREVEIRVQTIHVSSFGLEWAFGKGHD